MKNSLLFFILLVCFETAVSQTYNGWNLLYVSTDGNKFYYNVKAISVDNWPPSKIRTPILVLDKENKISSNSWYEFNCNEKSIKANSDIQKLTITQPILLANQGNTVGKNMLQLLCGFQVDNKYWVHYFTILPTSVNQFNVLFVDLNNLNRISFTSNNESKEGIEIVEGVGNWDHNNFNTIFSISNTNKAIYRCSEQKIYSYEKGNNYVGTDFSMIEGSGLPGFHYALCQGIYSKLIKTKNVQSTTNTSQSSNLNIDDAKKKCLDLGLKTGTESFGKCVLQLSK